MIIKLSPQIQRNELLDGGLHSLSAFLGLGSVFFISQMLRRAQVFSPLHLRIDWLDAEPLQNLPSVWLRSQKMTSDSLYPHLLHFSHISRPVSVLR